MSRDEEGLMKRRFDEGRKHLQFGLNCGNIVTLQKNTYVNGTGVPIHVPERNSVFV